METKSKQCKVVMLTTSKAENSIIRQFGSLKNHTHEYLTQSYLRDIGAESLHIYITSDEEIKEGDYYIVDNIRVKELRVANEHKSGITNKVIATTDAILNLPKPKQSFIDKYIKEYNKGNIITSVLVEYKDWCDYDDDNDWPGGLDTPDLRININSNNEVIIKKVKDSWTEEELHQHMQYYMEYCEYNNYITPMDWINTKL